MKVLSLNFLTCAVKACKSSSDSYPLHPKNAELVQDDIEVNPELLVNVLPRLDWKALSTTAMEVCSFFFLSLFLFFPLYLSVYVYCLILYFVFCGFRLAFYFNSSFVS